MNRSSLELEQHKQQLIKEFMLPLFGECQETPEIILSKINNICQLHHVLKSQQLESPGSHEEGTVWFSIQAMAHSYHYHKIRKVSFGTRIWKKREFIFDPFSLLQNDFREEYLEMLEPGEVLSIPYGKMRLLMDEIPEIATYIKRFSLISDQYFRHQLILVHDSPLQRVEAFEAENPLFCAIASNTIKAMHVGLSRQGYEAQLKRLRNRE